MDKQEYREIVSDIRRAHDNQEYDKVLMYADELDMRRVSDSRVLEMISDAYVVSGDLETARDLMLKAYEKTPMGRKLAYKLSEISLRLGDLDGAVDFYEDFCKMAPHDNDRYLLKYKIGRAGNVPKKDLAKVLASYCDKEVDERWMAELAGIYDEIGETEKCDEVCDDIILWFADGVYVQRALELKSRNGGLTEAQQTKYEQLRAAEKAKKEAARVQEEDRKLHPGNMGAEELPEDELDSYLEEFITVEDASAPPLPPRYEDMADAMSEFDDEIDYVDITEPETEVIPIHEIRKAADNAEDAEENILMAKAEAKKAAEVEAASFAAGNDMDFLGKDSLLEELELQTAPVHEEVQDIIAGNMGPAEPEEVPDVLSGALPRKKKKKKPLAKKAPVIEAPAAEEVQPAEEQPVVEEAVQPAQAQEEEAPFSETAMEQAPAVEEMPAYEEASEELAPVLEEAPVFEASAYEEVPVAVESPEVEEITGYEIPVIEDPAFEAVPTVATAPVNQKTRVVEVKPILEALSKSEGSAPEEIPEEKTPEEAQPLPVKEIAVEETEAKEQPPVKTEAEPQKTSGRPFFSNIQATQSARTAPPKDESSFWKMPDELTLEEDAAEEEFPEPVYGSHRWFEEKNEPEFTQPIYGSHRFVPRDEEEEELEDADVLIEQVEPEPIVIEPAEEEEPLPEHISTIRTTSSSAELMGLYAAAKASGSGNLSSQASLVKKPALGGKKVLPPEMFADPATEPEYYEGPSLLSFQKPSHKYSDIEKAEKEETVESEEAAPEEIPVPEEAPATDDSYKPEDQGEITDEFERSLDEFGEEQRGNDQSDEFDKKIQEFRDEHHAKEWTGTDEEDEINEEAAAEEETAGEAAAEEEPAETPEVVFLQDDENPVAEEAPEAAAEEEAPEMEIPENEEPQSDFERAMREFDKERKEEEGSEEEDFVPEVDDLLEELDAEKKGELLNKYEAVPEWEPVVKLEDETVAGETEFIPAAEVKEQIEIQERLETAPQIQDDEAEEIDNAASQLVSELFDEEPEIAEEETLETDPVDERTGEAETQTEIFPDLAANVAAMMAEDELLANEEADEETEEDFKAQAGHSGNTEILNMLTDEFEKTLDLSDDNQQIPVEPMAFEDAIQAFEQSKAEETEEEEKPEAEGELTEEFERSLDQFGEEQSASDAPSEFEATVQEFEREERGETEGVVPEEFLVETETGDLEMKETVQEAPEEEPAEAQEEELTEAPEEELAEEDEEDDEEEERFEDDPRPAPFMISVMPHTFIEEVVPDIVKENLAKAKAEKEKAEAPVSEALNETDSPEKEEELTEEFEQSIDQFEEEQRAPEEPTDFEQTVQEFEQEHLSEEIPVPEEAGDFAAAAVVVPEMEEPESEETAPEAAPSVFVSRAELDEETLDKITAGVEEGEAAPVDGSAQDLKAAFDFKDDLKEEELSEFEPVAEDFELTHPSEGFELTEEYGVAEPEVDEAPIIEITASLPKVDEELEAEAAEEEETAEEEEQEAEPTEAIEEAAAEEAPAEFEGFDEVATELLDEMQLEAEEEGEVLPSVAGLFDEPDSEDDAELEEVPAPEETAGLSDFEKAIREFDEGGVPEEEDFTQGEFVEAMDELIEETTEPWEEPEFGVPNFEESQYEKPEFLGNDFDLDDDYRTEKLIEEEEKKEVKELDGFEKALAEFDQENKDSLIEPFAGEPEFEEEFPESFAEDAEFEEEFPEPLDEEAAPVGYQLPDDLREELSEFLLIEGMEARICAAIGSIIERKRSGDPTGGHLLVTGDAKSGKTYLTIALIKAVGKEIGSTTGRVAKVQAESLNGKDMRKVFNKISGSDLIIENAGYLSDDTVERLMDAMENSSSGTMVVLEGNQLGIENILTKNPHLEELFHTRLDLDELSLSQWADLACAYAEEKGYKVGDMALLALHAKIDEMNLPTTRLVVEDVHGIIDQAIEKASKRTSGRFRGRRKKGENVQELNEEDFI